MTPARAPSAAAARRTRVSSGIPARFALPGRRPLHPGQFLDSRFLKPLAISQTALAEALGISRRRVNELIRGRRAITPDTAMRLALFFGNDAAFWMHLQVAWDMRLAQRTITALTQSKRR